MPLIFCSLYDLFVEYEVPRLQLCVSYFHKSVNSLTLSKPQQQGNEMSEDKVRKRKWRKTSVRCWGKAGEVGISLEVPV